MSLNAKKAPSAMGGGNTPPLESGTYPARVVHVVALGLQTQRPYKGQEKPPAHMIALTYEFVDEFMLDEDGNEQEDKPRHLTESFPLYNLSSEKAKSTKRYYALDPIEEYDGEFSELVETPCMVTVTQNPGEGKHKGKVFSNVTDVSPMRDKDAKKCPALVNPPVVFSLDDPDLKDFRTLPKWMQEVISNNLEFEGSKLQVVIEEAGEDQTEEVDDSGKAPLDDDENPY